MWKSQGSLPRWEVKRLFFPPKITPPDSFILSLVLYNFYKLPSKCIHPLSLINNVPSVRKLPNPLLQTEDLPSPTFPKLVSLPSSFCHKMRGEENVPCISATSYFTQRRDTVYNSFHRNYCYCLLFRFWIVLFSSFHSFYFVFFWMFDRC